MKQIKLNGKFTQDIYAETHNDWETFILHQDSPGNEQRPTVKNAIVMTKEQLESLIAALSDSKTLPTTVEGWRTKLDSTLEHASHAWVNLQKEGAKEKDPELWPPQSLDKTGTTAYHVAAMIEKVYEVFCGISVVFPEEEKGSD